MKFLALIVLGWLLCGWVTFRMWLRRSPPYWSQFAREWRVYDMDHNDISVRTALLVSVGLWPFAVLITSVCAIGIGIKKAGSLVIPRAYRSPPRDP
jgi:hypothetical protein